MFKIIEKHKLFFILMVVALFSAIIFIALIVYVPLIVHILYKIEAPIPWFTTSWTPDGLLSYIGSTLGALLGALATIVVVFLNIEFIRSNQKKERKHSIKPHLATYTNAISNSHETRKEKNITYLLYPLDGNIGSRLTRPDDLDENKTNEYLMVQYGIENVGGGSAINIDFSVDHKKAVPPFSLAVNGRVCFILIIYKELVVKGDHPILFKFAFYDTASTGHYEQEEEIIIYTEHNGTLNMSQKPEKFISIPKDI